MRIFKSIYLVALAAITLASCGSVKNMAVPTMDTTVNATTKKGTISDEDFNHWAHADLVTDSIPGMSLDKAYKFVEGKTSTTVIVGVIDSGIDIEHEDLKDVLWVNTKEIPGNRIDDDKNGYVDDIYGWNFLGGNGVSAPEQLEITRLYKKLSPKYEGKTDKEIETLSKVDNDNFAAINKSYKKAYDKAKKQYDFYSTFKSTLLKADETIKEKLGKSSYVLEDLQAIAAENKEDVAILSRVLGSGSTVEEYAKQLDGGIKYFGSQVNVMYNLDLDGRAIVGDNPEDITDVVYGNPHVIGSVDDEIHGTHVSGIILANRTNNIGMKGVANNAVLMSVRAVPDGDERDKDVALAIRYAVDNGAKVINMSFGKSWSPNPEWVFDAIKYAEKNDVLLVHAAGNDGKDIDVSENWPNDTTDKINEIADNVLTIGAMSSNYDEKMPATFSNYGQKNVDVFAPGVDIYSTFPKNEYQKISGTSMAAPEVAGVAALVRSYYPKLSASQVKHIIMNSGTTVDMEVLVPGKKGEKAKFTTLSISGKVLNAYNALVLADKMVNKK